MDESDEMWDLICVSQFSSSPIYPSAPTIGHVGDGNFHTLLLVDVENPQEVAAAKELTHKMAR